VYITAILNKEATLNEKLDSELKEIMGGVGIKDDHIVMLTSLIKILNDWRGWGFQFQVDGEVMTTDKISTLPDDSLIRLSIFLMENYIRSAKQELEVEEYEDRA
jgi:hypothetical protein